MIGKRIKELRKKLTNEYADVCLKDDQAVKIDTAPNYFFIVIPVILILAYLFIPKIPYLLFGEYNWVILLLFIIIISLLIGWFNYYRSSLIIDNSLNKVKNRLQKRYIESIRCRR